MKKYELMPKDGHKSFYGKAVVYDDKGYRTLYSYGVKIMTIAPAGFMLRYWNGQLADGTWSRTTGRHIKAFSGLNKAEYLALPKR